VKFNAGRIRFENPNWGPNHNACNYRPLHQLIFGLALEKTHFAGAVAYPASAEVEDRVPCRDTGGADHCLAKPFPSANFRPAFGR
jgi:hypothetical protein